MGSYRNYLQQVWDGAIAAVSRNVMKKDYPFMYAPADAVLFEMMKVAQRETLWKDTSKKNFGFELGKCPDT